MTGQCCSRERPSGRLARRLSGTAASILPGTLLMLLPKCPLCLAAWLAVATGVGVSEAAAAWMRDAILAFWLVAAGVTAVQMVRCGVHRQVRKIFRPNRLGLFQKT